MTDRTIETDEQTAPETWLEEVCDALFIERSKLGPIKPAILDLVHHVATSPGEDDDAPMTAFLIGFAAAKDGDFSPESVQARVNVVAKVLEEHNARA